jgi:hypothetical protein
MAMTGMKTWIMWATASDGGGSVSSTLKFPAASIEAQAVIHAFITFDSESMAQAAISGYWHLVNGKEKFVDLSDGLSSAKFIDNCTGVRFQVLVSYAKCGALANIYFFD